METHFTYKQFVTNHSFSLLDPIFEVILLFAAILLMIVFLKMYLLGFVYCLQDSPSLFQVSCFGLVVL